MSVRPTRLNVLDGVLGAISVAVGLGLLAPAAARAQCPAATFAPAATYTLPSSGRSVAIGNFNGDSLPDIVTSYTTGASVGVLLNAGAVAFGAVIPRTVAAAPSAVAVGYFDTDSNLDVALAYSGTGFTTTLSILMGNGDGTLQAAVDYPAGGTTRNIAVGNFNADARPDLAVSTGAGVAMHLNNGDGTFATPVLYGGAISVLWTVVADFNRDGIADLGLAISGGTVGVMLGNGNGTFQSAVTTSVTQGVAIAAGNLNGDDNPDLAVATSGVGSLMTVLLGNGLGGFGAPATYAGAASPQNVAIADFNGDGKPDIVSTGIAAASTNAFVYQNNGDGTFQPGVAIATIANTFRAAAGDLSGDGLPDFVVTSTNVASIAVVINTSAPCLVTCCRGATCGQVVVAACVPNGTNLGVGVACNAPGNFVTPCCKANFNQTGGVSVQDIFAFLTAWFVNDPIADFDGVGGVAVADIFGFLSAWFAGCP